MVLLESDAKTLQPGSAAPQFTLKNIDEEMVSLKDFEGFVTVIIFMCNHCPYVIPKLEEIANMQNEYASKGVVVVCINSNDPTNYPEDDFEHMQHVAVKMGYNFYLLDDSQEVARAYGATCTPDPFVFDKEHKLVYHGRINDQMEPQDPVTEKTMRTVLDKVLRGEKVEEWFVPSIGCSIKWKD